MGKRGAKAGAGDVQHNHLTQASPAAMMPLRNECLRWARQPNYRVALNRLVADDFCCYVMSFGHHAAAGVFFVLEEKCRKTVHRAESNACSTPIAASCLWVSSESPSALSLVPSVPFLVVCSWQSAPSATSTSHCSFPSSPSWAWPSYLPTSPGAKAPIEA